MYKTSVKLEYEVNIYIILKLVKVTFFNQGVETKNNSNILMIALSTKLITLRKTVCRMLNI